MNRQNYAECVYRLAKICEVTNSPLGGLTREENQMQYETADKISESIEQQKEFYFDTILSYLNEKHNTVVELHETDGENGVRREYKEGPVIVFPSLQIKIDQITYNNRNCNTVCIGENRSKLWVRLSLNDEKKDSEAVKRFYGNAKDLTTCIGDAIFHCYKTILAKENYDLNEVYNIHVAGTTSLEKRVGTALLELDKPNTTITKLFDRESAIVNSTREVIFPFYQMEDEMYDFESCSLKNSEGFDWVSVIDPVTDGRSIFLSNDRDSKTTSFVGFGYDPTGTELVMQKATKDILTLLSPNL